MHLTVAFLQLTLDCDICSSHVYLILNRTLIDELIDCLLAIKTMQTLLYDNPSPAQSFRSCSHCYCNLSPSTLLLVILFFSFLPLFPSPFSFHFPLFSITEFSSHLSLLCFTFRASCGTSSSRKTLLHMQGTVREDSRINTKHFNMTNYILAILNEPNKVASVTQSTSSKQNMAVPHKLIMYSFYTNFMYYELSSGSCWLWNKAARLQNE